MLDRIGGFDEAIVHMPDWDLCLRLWAEDPGVGCREALVAYVQHPQMLSFRQTAAFEADLATIDAKLAEPAAGAPTRASRRDSADRAARRGLLEWMATRHLTAGARGPAAHAWLRSAAAGRRPDDLLRAAAALAGPRPFRAVDSRLSRRFDGDGAPVPPAPDWLAGYPDFPPEG
jgi:hypothetical protein